MNKEKYIWIKIAATMLIGAGILKLSAFLLKNVGPEIVTAIPAYLISIAVLLLLAAFLGEEERITSLRTGWKAFFTKGWYILVVSVIFLLLLVLGLSQQKELVFSPFHFVCFTVVCVLTACFEEIWFRGIIQGILMRHGKKTGVSFWKTACITSALFGAMHLVNLMYRPEYVVGTITQVLYAFSLGMILSMVVYGGGSIGAAALLHAVFNFSGSLSEVFIQKAAAQQGDMPVASAVFILILVMPGIIVARRMYNKMERTPEGFS